MRFRSAMVSRSYIGTISKRWFLKNRPNDHETWSTWCHVETHVGIHVNFYIHLACTNFVGPWKHSVKRNWTGSAFSTNESASSAIVTGSQSQNSNHSTLRFLQFSKWESTLKETRLVQIKNDVPVKCTRSIDPASLPGWLKPFVLRVFLFFLINFFSPSRWFHPLSHLESQSRYWEVVREYMYWVAIHWLETSKVTDITGWIYLEASTKVVKQATCPLWC